MKKIVFQDKEYYYSTYHNSIDYTKFYTKETGTRKKYLLFGPVVTIDIYVPEFELVGSIENPEIPRKYWREKLEGYHTRARIIAEREEEIKRGELI